MPMRQPATRFQLTSFFWPAVLVCGFLCAFVLPFLFPLRHAVYSPVYTAGGNNRVGALATAVLSVLVTAWLYVFGKRSARTPESAETSSRLEVRWEYLAMLLLCGLNAVLGFLVVRSGSYYADAAYFVTQLRSGLVFHNALYTGVEFAYGPLLYVWPAAFAKVLGAVNVSLQASYFVSLVVAQVIGTAMAFYTVAALPLRKGMKLAAFAVLVIISCDPQAGLNYTPLRFILPAASVVFLTRKSVLWKAAVAAAVLEALAFGISPELGFAFGGAALAYAAYRAVITSAAWLLVAASALGGGGLFAVCFGTAYFRTFAEFAKGGYNMLLEPAPHIYLLLICAVVLAPLAVADALRSPAPAHRPEYQANGGLLLGIYITGLALLTPALGRCDPLHVAFNGWALFLLSFVALERFSRRARTVGICVMLLFSVYSVAQECLLGKGALEHVVLGRADKYENGDLSRLRTAIGPGKVTFPWNTPMRLIDGLTASGQYQPLYLDILAVDRDAELRTLREMRSADYALAPGDEPLATENAINNVGLKYRLRFGYRYKPRFQPFLQGALLAQELQQHWQFVGTFGYYRLYRKVS